MSLSILLVDDNDVNLKVASLMIKKLGHHADLATNGIEAIEAIEHQSYDVVLMDIQMPEMDGIEATKIIRQRWHHNLKIIIVTSLDNYREICLEAGADDFLTKPLRFENLRKTISCDMSIPYFGEFVSSGLVENATTCDIWKKNNAMLWGIADEKCYKEENYGEKWMQYHLWNRQHLIVAHFRNIAGIKYLLILPGYLISRRKKDDKKK